LHWEKPQGSGDIMNTLTQFINQQLSLSHQLTAGEGQEVNEANASGLYEVIENESLSSTTLKGLVISGSLFSLTTFTDVTFESCAFYASKLENCTFINCNFNNCNFEFTGLQHCTFNKCSWDQTQFKVSPLKKNRFSFCNLDVLVAHAINKEENSVYECVDPEVLTWEEILEGDQAASEFTGNDELKIDIAGESDERTHGGLMDAISHALAKFKAA